MAIKEVRQIFKTFAPQTVKQYEDTLEIAKINDNFRTVDGRIKELEQGLGALDSRLSDMDKGMKLLFSGSWASGSIVAPGFKDFDIFRITVADIGTPMIGWRNNSRSELRAYCMYASGIAGNDPSMVLNMLTNGDTITLTIRRRMSHVANDLHGVSYTDMAVTGIWGVM
ncbi:MAG: hypothetical protein ACOYJD_08350 [Christensenellales bacterium]|jgi:hypothetical protein